MTKFLFMSKKLLLTCGFAVCLMLSSTVTASTGAGAGAGQGRGEDPTDQRSAERLMQAIQSEFRDHSDLLDASRDKHIVAFLGNTGAGKSTLVNLLAGKELRIGESGQDYILANPNDETSMAIGDSGSTTFYPKFIKVEEEELYLFDLPGFHDTDGSERNLVNSAFIRQILTQAASVRLVFVISQEEFVASRGEPARNMVAAVKKLFDNIGSINHSVFVATKSTHRDPEGAIRFLGTKTAHMPDLRQQLDVWTRDRRFHHIQNPLLKIENTLAEDNAALRNRILTSIRQSPSSRIERINISALYPEETTRDLVRIFFYVMPGVLDRKLDDGLITIPQIDSALEHLSESQNFWRSFESDLCREFQSVSLLREFCGDPYREALANFKRENERRHQNYIATLRERRDVRVETLEDLTDRRARDIIANHEHLRVNLEQNLVAFDFAYHQDFYGQVCGANSITAISTEAIEQEIVRRYYAGFISRHSHDQMITWHQRFITPQIDRLEAQIMTLTERLELLERNARPPEPPVIERPLATPIPAIARGYEAIYERFLRGKLIYRPTAGSDVGKVELSISDFLTRGQNPLESTFDLSRCGDAATYLSVSTGYKKAKIPANANKSEVWIVPKFVVGRDAATAPAQYRAIIEGWNATTAPFALFYTWGGHDNLEWYDYLTTRTPEQINTANLYENYMHTFMYQYNNITTEHRTLSSILINF